MKIASVFTHVRAAGDKFGWMILRHLEAGTHVVEDVGVFFFDEKTFVLREGDPDRRPTLEGGGGAGDAPDDA